MVILLLCDVILTSSQGQVHEELFLGYEAKKSVHVGMGRCWSGVLGERVEGEGEVALVQDCSALGIHVLLEAVGGPTVSYDAATATESACLHITRSVGLGRRHDNLSVVHSKQLVQPQHQGQWGVGGQEKGVSEGGLSEERETVVSHYKVAKWIVPALYSR